MDLLISAKSRENGSSSNVRCSFGTALTLGRGPESPLVLDGTGISREHLRLHTEDDSIFITDLSSNGTWVNECRLTRGQPHPFTPADVVNVPGFEIHIDLAEMATPPTPRTPPPAPIPSGQADAPSLSGRGLEKARALVGSLATVEGLLVLLAFATLSFVGFYLAS